MKFLKKTISKLPISIGGGFMIAIFTIVPIMAALDFLIPGGFHASFEEFFPRWFIVCTVISLLYFSNKANSSNSL